MCYEFLEVGLVVYVEAAPEVTADDDASEAQRLCHTDIVEAHAAECVHMPVDESLVSSILKLLLCESLLLFAELYAVEDVFQEYAT